MTASQSIILHRLMADATPTAPRGSLLLQRALLWTDRRPLRPLWAGAYEAAARAYGRWLVGRDRSATVYVRGSVASRRPRPGLSDLDLAIVVDDHAAERAITARHEGLERSAPWLSFAVLEPPRIYPDADLELVANASVLTAGRPVYGPGLPSGVIRHLERPGLDGPFAGWRRLRGPVRRLPEGAADERIAAWLEIQYRWRWAWRALEGTMPAPRERDIAANLVLESARAASVIGASVERAERAMAQARAIAAAPGRDEPRVLDRLIPAALELAGAAAAALEASLDDVTEVRLAGDVAAGDPLPLVDWRTVVRSSPPDAAFVPLPGDARDPAVLREAQLASERGPYPALRHGRLLLLAPGPYFRSALRAVQCATTDPVSFALLDGARVASFPRVRGWSAEDLAARAVAEHRTRLDADALDPLVGAARAGLFAGSLADGEPELPLTAAATLERLGAGPDVDAVRDAVRRLPAYR